MTTDNQYMSPIQIMCGQMQIHLEDDIYKVVQNYDISIDKNELFKALKYDREQYEKGYKDAVRKVTSELKYRLVADCDVVSEGNWLYGITAKGYNIDEATEIINNLEKELVGDI